MIALLPAALSEFLMSGPALMMRGKRSTKLMPAAEPAWTSVCTKSWMSRSETLPKLRMAHDLSGVLGLMTAWRGGGEIGRARFSRRERAGVRQERAELKQGQQLTARVDEIELSIADRGRAVGEDDAGRGQDAAQDLDGRGWEFEAVRAPSGGSRARRRETHLGHLAVDHHAPRREPPSAAVRDGLVVVGRLLPGLQDFGAALVRRLARLLDGLARLLGRREQERDRLAGQELRVRGGKEEAGQQQSRTGGQRMARRRTWTSSIGTSWRPRISTHGACGFSS